MTTNITIHQEVYIQTSSDRYIKGHVVGVSPTGLVSVLTSNSGAPYRFNADGRERGASKYTGCILRTDVENVEKAIAYKTAKQNTNRTVAAILDTINGQHNGCGNYNITSEAKEKLLALVNSL